MRLGHATGGEVVDDGGLEADVRVQDQTGAEDGVHDGVEGTGCEGGDAQGNEADGDQTILLYGQYFLLYFTSFSNATRGVNVPLKSPVVAAFGGVRLGDGSGVVHWN